MNTLRQETLNKEIFTMTNDGEIKAATDVVPIARAYFIIQGVEGWATKTQLKTLLELMVWAYGFDRDYDWTWNLKDCPLLREVSSYQKAAEVIEGWFGKNQFPLREKWQDEHSVFENWILPALETWVEDRYEGYLASSTWKGVKGHHGVHWDTEKQGHVVLYEGDNFNPVFDYQL